MNKIILIAVFIIASVTVTALQPPTAPSLKPAHNNAIINIREHKRTHYTPPTNERLNVPEIVTGATGIGALSLGELREFITAGEEENIGVVYPGKVIEVPQEPTVKNPPGVHVTPHNVINPAKYIPK